MSDFSGITASQRTIEDIIEAQAASKKGETRNTGELGKDDFLKLLITQVQNQDPLNPASDTDFIAQMAQFSALEQMQNLNQSFSYSMGLSLMGKYITAEITDKATGDVKFVSGKVDMVRMSGGTVYAVVGNDEVPVDKITQVADDSIGIGGDVTDYSGIIGMFGKATITNADGKTSSIDGIITTVTKEKGGIYATLDEVEILPEDLDIGAFENEEEYVKGMIGKEVTIKFKDSNTGYEFRVTGILRAGYEGEDGKLRLVLDAVKVPVGTIYSTERIDLISTEHMLLNAILKELQKQNGSGEETDPEETGDTGEETEPVTETEPET